MGGKNSYESIKRYEDKAYDKVLVRMPKGRKDEIKTHAAACGQSVNAYINGAIDERMARNGPQQAAEAPPGAGAVSVSLPADALETAQEAAEAAGEGLPQFIGRAVTTQAQRDALARKMEGGEHNGN